MVSRYKRQDHAQALGIRLVQGTDGMQRNYDICN